MNKTEQRKVTGVFLRFRRVSQLQTRKEVAEAIDCTEKEITAMENGEIVAPGLLERYANLVKVEPKYVK